MGIVWSTDKTAFEPIHLDGPELIAFEQTARRARDVLARAALGDAAAASDLTRIGRDLHAQFFSPGVGPEVSNWLRALGDIESLEIGTDSPGRVPYAIFDDAEYPGA